MRGEYAIQSYWTGKVYSCAAKEDGLCTVSLDWIRDLSFTLVVALVNAMVSMTLSSFLMQKAVSSELQNVLFAVLDAVKLIRKEIQHYNTRKLVSKNASGETQMELDKQSDVLFFNAMKKNGVVHSLASEERETVEILNPCARYSIALDPLDGSSLIDVNLAIGTVVGIHEGPVTVEKRNIVAALYVVYGPLTTLVLAPGQGKGVSEFLLSEDEWYLTRENIDFLEKGKIYSPGGERKSWSEGHKKYIAHLEQEGYKLRFSGCLVADANQVLLKGGGIFCYPQTPNAPEGKLRVLYELEPLTFIFEEAGGKGSDGKQTLLGKSLTNIHQKSPAYLGSTYEVELAEKMLN